MMKLFDMSQIMMVIRFISKVLLLASGGLDISIHR
ncbi:hypothetical protein I3843_03G106800 [Carya illinoinensis]|nr:hypothetical protein I3843_03G106800 [Carya illinoinensis]